MGLKLAGVLGEDFLVIKQTLADLQIMGKLWLEEMFSIIYL